MIVPIFNYHLSIITIMGKNNKSLYINILSNFLFEEILCTVSDYNPVEYLLF